jgi:hypothetical protein
LAGSAVRPDRAASPACALLSDRRAAACLKRNPEKNTRNPTAPGLLRFYRAMRRHDAPALLPY